MATKILATDSQTKSSKQGLMPGTGRSRWPIYLVAVLAVVAVLVVAGLYMREADRADKAARIASDVKVGDLSLGGMTVAEAETAIQQHFASVESSQIALTLNDRSWSFSAADLGVKLDAAETARAAHDIHSGDVVAAEAVTNTTTDVQLVLTHNIEAARAKLASVEKEVAVTEVSAELKVSAAGVILSPSIEGQKLDTEATLKNIEAATAALPFKSATVVANKIAPLINDADLTPAFTLANSLSSEPITLSLANAGGAATTWVLKPEDLRSMLTISKDAAGKAVVADKLDEKALNTFLTAIAPKVHLDPSDATLALPDFATSATMTAETIGRDLDVTATLARLQAAAAATGAARTVEPVLTVLPAKVTVAQLQPVKENIDRVMKDGVTLTGNNRTYVVPADQVVLKLYLQKTEGTTPSYSPLVYDADMTDLANKAAKELDTDAQNAKYRLVNGAVTLTQQPAEGYEVDVEATAASIKDALLNGKTQAALAGTATPPTFADTNLSQISTPTMLQSDSTYYGASSAERNWNVTLGAEKLDGWYIAPGEVFSLNEAFGPLTLDAGFKMGWGIIVQGGNASTIPSEAGGICQVATTLFHPLFWLGVPFTERHHHSYWIEKYGHAPMGLTGLDATIDPPWSDLKFKNTTGNWLLIRASGDKKDVKVSLWGTDPGWRVEVAQPVITNVVKTDPKMRTEQNDQLPLGKTVVVETAQDGFDVDIHRQVFDSTGALINDWHAAGTYLPAHNVTMVGTGKDVAATPTP